jgi:RNA polymerase sigma-70 factor (ECF subfamily)
MKNKQNLLLDVLYRRYAGDVYRYAYSILCHQQEAEDAMQEVFLRIEQSKERFRGDCDTKRYLLILARNYCYNRRKQKSFHNKQIDELMRHPADNDHLDEHIALQTAMTQLTPEQSELLYLKEYSGYSYQEMAYMTGQTVASIKIKLYRTRQFLRELLNEG